MTEEPQQLDLKAEFVRKVALEQGISEAQIRNHLRGGYNYSSIVREARILKKEPVLRRPSGIGWIATNVPETATD